VIHCKYNKNKAKMNSAFTMSTTELKIPKSKLHCDTIDPRQVCNPQIPFQLFTFQTTGLERQLIPHG
jgi:hypothetical protein